jgi:hypothetical protein
MALSMRSLIRAVALVRYNKWTWHSAQASRSVADEWIGQSDNADRRIVVKVRINPTKLSLRVDSFAGGE